MIGDIQLECIAHNPSGMEIVVKEKYGNAIVDTATVVWWDANKACWVLTHRNKPSSYYPKENYSISFKKKEQK